MCVRRNGFGCGIAEPGGALVLSCDHPSFVRGTAVEGNDEVVVEIALQPITPAKVTGKRH